MGYPFQVERIHVQLIGRTQCGDGSWREHDYFHLLPSIGGMEVGRGSGERSMNKAGGICKSWIIIGLEILLMNLGFLSLAMESH